MEWKQIKRVFLQSVGETQDAHDELWEHLNFGYRWLFGTVDMPEHHIPDATVNTVANQDWIDVDDDLYAIDWITNTVDGRKLDPEWDGMRGRARYIDSGQVIPPTGSPKFYTRQGTKIFLRDTPDAIIRLLISFRFFPEWVDATSDLTQHPLSPAQYDMAIVFRAVANYFKLHVPVLGDGQRDYVRAAEAKNAAVEIISEVEDPRAEEHLDRRSYVQQAGYDMGLRGR